MADRRTFLRGLATLPLVGGGVGSAAAAPSGVNDLWLKLMLAQGSLTQMSDALNAAEDRLPWWAKAGPSYVDHAGELSGPNRGWPALETYTLPQHEGSFRIIRIGPQEVERRAETRRWLTNAARAQELRAKDEADLEARYARKAAEEQALGIPALTKATDDAFDAWADLADVIEGLPDGSLDVAAAKILIQLQREAQVDATADGSCLVSLAAVALRGLLPHLDGLLAVDVADVLADPGRPVREMRISRGLLPNGDVAEAGA